MQLSHLTSATPRHDIGKSRKDATPENLLRMKIVEMAGKNSNPEEKASGNPARRQSSKEPQNKYSKRTDTFVPLSEDKKRSVLYPILQRNKDPKSINLKFTSFKKDTKDESRSRRISKQEDTAVKEKSSTTALHQHQNLKNKTTPNNTYNDNSSAQEYSKFLRSKSAKTVVPSPPGPRKEPTHRPKSTHYGQDSPSNEHGKVHKSDLAQNDTRGDSPNRSQSHAKNGYARQNNKDNLLKYEIKGNAMSTAPQHQGSVYLLSSRRAGLFSASLAAFKRRLRLSSKKFTARLHDDSSSKEEEYIISVDAANNGMRIHQDEALRQSLHSIQNRPSNPRRVSFNMPSANDILNGHRTPRMRPPSNTGKYAENAHSDQESMSNSSRSSQDDNQETPIKSNYKLQGIGQNTPRGKLQAGLPSVTSAKTYVLETGQLPVVESKNSEPIPLTAHNVRLHDSLISMYVRRSRRLERTRRMMTGDKMNHNNTMTPLIAGYANPNERIEKWLQQVAEQESVEAHTPEPANNKNLHILPPCSAETGFDFQQSHKTAILV